MYSADSEISSAASLQPSSLHGVVSSWLQLPVFTVIGCFALFAVAFGNLLDIEADNAKVGFGGQAAVKVMFLGLAGLYGGVGFLTDPKMRRLMFTFPVVWMFILLGCFFLSVPTSSSAVQSLASTISIACVLLMTVTALVQLGPKLVLDIVYWAMGCFVIGSWLTYLLVPSVGVFLEPTTEGAFIPRMGGLTHPNTLGQIAGLTVVLGLLFLREPEMRTWLRTLLVLAAFAALIGSLSRTSLLATMVAFSVAFRDYIFDRKYAMMAIVFAIAGVMALMTASMFMDVQGKVMSKLDLLSKSGDASELASATGRTAIWGKTIQLIGERPLFGYGAATSKFWLQEYSMHTHNLILNIAFSTGVLGGLIAVWMCLERIFKVIVSRHPFADAIIVFILVNGLFENVVFSILCGLPTILWTIGLALPAMEEFENDKSSVSIDHPILRVSTR
jgi:O-antigen ligase